MNILKSAAAYESWLRARLHGELVKKDLKEKHEKMGQSPFVFLRATYWRWAERIPQLCPELDRGPVVLAIGDIHVENFGTWRDDDGRLVWGVNDFDEAARMPYAFDLLRLATSAFLGQVASQRPTGLPAICDAILKGYRQGLKSPSPFILDKDHPDMRARFVATEEQRAKFWQKIQPKPDARSRLPPARFKAALDKVLPAGAQAQSYWPRSAGVGSLGRPRWVVLAQWKGGPVIREAKAILPSAWDYAQGQATSQLQVTRIASGRYRAPDPWFRVSARQVATRRLSPNNHKIEMESLGGWLFEHDLLEAMGREIANIHLGTRKRSDRILSHIEARPAGWLAQAAQWAVECTVEDFEAWKKRPTPKVRNKDSSLST